jgi:hypothetical protein
MSAKKAEEKKVAPAPAAPTEQKPEEVIANTLIAELDRVHVRTPRY